MKQSANDLGRVTRIAGPVVGAAGLEHVQLYDVVRVGELGLVGEVIRLAEGQTTIQVYEDTSGIRVGEPVQGSGFPLVVQLGPGLLGQVYDGLQRPLEALGTLNGEFIQRGVSASPLAEDKRWHFTPCVNIGDEVGPGDILGMVPESQMLTHAIMVPPNRRGRVVSIAEGDFYIHETVAVLACKTKTGVEDVAITLIQHWPVRKPRPCQQRLALNEPLLTGTRVIDAFFPIAKGGSAIIPGGFGTGKTVTEHSIARWAAADVVVYVGCGERGNEMTEVLEEFPKLEDPRTGRPLIERTVLIANTSNMPVAAREASIYTGITIAEYYRDMGCDVLLLADSTSRWGEALREISGRLEEMPGEEGYPAYLAARLAEFYERSGRVQCLGRRDAYGEMETGSISVIGAVSPPGGDFSEPVTQNSMRVASTFWGLDYDLSRRRHFPAINWSTSYSLYDLRAWFSQQVAADWNDLCAEAIALLQREVELLEIVRLVGPDALAESERGILAIARMLREDFLQQSAYRDIDRYCPIQKTYWMLKTVLDFHRRTQSALAAGVPLAQVMALPVAAEIARMKESEIKTAEQEIQDVLDRVQSDFASLGGA